MPYKSAKIKIANTQYDRRIKLTDEQREEIKTLSDNGMSQKKLAKEFNVSKRLIQFVIYPEKAEICRQQFKERRRDGRYKPLKEDWAATQREHRRYKQRLKVEGEI